MISSLLPGRYGFRFDDVHASMDWSKFERLRDMMVEFQVRPLIAVIPDCKDPSLQESAPRTDFWQQIAELAAAGWSIGMHGYQHLALTTDRGLLRVATKSEFAGLPYEAQLEKIRSSLVCFSKQAIQVSCFVAPFHSYDRNTLAALKAVGIRVVSDGIALLPYEEDGIVFIPQMTEWPRRFGIGVHTFCLHPSQLSENQFHSLRQFIERNRDNIISFKDAVGSPAQSRMNSVFNKSIELVLRTKRSLVR